LNIGGCWGDEPVSSGFVAALILLLL
jgi:hypothetical protein